MDVLDLISKDDVEEYIKTNYTSKETYHLVILDGNRYIRFDIKPRSFIRRLIGKKWNVFVNTDCIRLFKPKSNNPQFKDEENWKNFIKSKSTGVKPE